jgi:hypothetical protein
VWVSGDVQGVKCGLECEMRGCFMQCRSFNSLKGVRGDVKTVLKLWELTGERGFTRGTRWSER